MGRGRVRRRARSWIGACSVVTIVTGAVIWSGALAGAASTSAVTKAKATVTAHEQKVTFPVLPTGPVPAKNKTIFIISSDQSLTGDIRTVAAVEQAVKLLGWKYVLVDGKSNPTTQNAGFEEAATQHAYAVIDVYIDSASVGSGMAALSAAHIPVIGVLSGSPTSGPNAVTATVGSSSFNHQMGALGADYAIAASNGQAHALVLWTTTFALDPPIGHGQATTFKPCKTCTVDVVHFAVTHLVTGVPGLVETALRQHPTINYVLTPYDASVSYADQGIRDAGSNAQTISTGGNKPNLTLIRGGSGEVAVAAEPLEYIGFLSLNNLIRIEGGKKPLPFAAPLKVLVASNLPPAGQSWTGDTNYVLSFKKLWAR